MCAAYRQHHTETKLECALFVFFTYLFKLYKLKKQHFVLIGVALLFTQILSATTLASCDSLSPQKKHTYDAWLQSRTPKGRFLGQLCGVSDSSLSFKPLKPAGTWATQEDWQVVPVSYIESISFRRKNSFGIGIGIVLGLAGLGAMAGIKTAKHPETESSPVLLVRILGGFTVGTLLGVAIGFKKKKIMLNGDQKRLVKNRAQLQQYVQ